MKIETKYNFGDTVYKIRRRFVPIRNPCGFCGGSGRIIGANNDTKSCPECYGKRQLATWEAQKWQVDEDSLTIGQIRTESTCKHDGDSIYENYGSQEERYKEVYMAYETGIGSGSLHHVETLWPSREEAQAECDRINAAEEAGGER